MRFVSRASACLGAIALAAFLAGTAGAAIKVSPVVDVTRDELSQNETPVAINPANPANMITGSNDWNYNDGCGVNATFDGGKTWTGALPEGYLPGVTKYTNDPSVPGDGAYDAGGDPVVSFSPDGSTAYFVCQAFDFGGGGSGHQIALLLNRSTDGGKTWLHRGLTQISVFNGNGVSKGSNGQFPDHQSMWVDHGAASPHRGTIYVTWAQFSGNSNSDVYVAASRDGGRTFAAPVLVTTVGNLRNNQDQRIVTAPNGDAYLVFDNSLQGGKGTALYVSKSVDGGRSWSAPSRFGTVQNAVCLFPPDCFTISGDPFRAGGTYPAPAFDAARNRLDVIYADTIGGKAQIMFTWANASDLSQWSMPTAVAPGTGDRFQAEMSAAPNGRLDVSFYDRSYSANKLVDMTYATSSDGGQTWRKARVSPESFDPYAWGVPSGSALGRRPFLGDYNGIASTATSASLTWTGVAPPAPLNLEIDYATVTP